MISIPTEAELDLNHIAWCKQNISSIALDKREEFLKELEVRLTNLKSKYPELAVFESLG